METASLEAIWKIRDARGLDYKEKAFLFTVASRGAMTARWGTAAADMGMSKDTYYRTRDSLFEKNLLVVDGSTHVCASAQNPTWTIMALCWRSCDHVADQMKKGEV